MSAEVLLLRRTWRVGKYAVTFTVRRPREGQPIVNAAVGWAPCKPPQLSTDELREYRIGRDLALAELAGVLGGKVAVIET